RLDPLSPASIQALLNSELESAGSQQGVQGFLDEAVRRGIHSMLSNPLTLSLLARAVGSVGDWPESRLETFELACRTMAGEHNPEHQAAAHRARPSAAATNVSTLVHAAGYLCAVILLVGRDG
ncbi:MAG: hypothetical protein OXI48_08240, partial [bacterium]|nr:hypothetical protein [bacterium]